MRQSGEESFDLVKHGFRRVEPWEVTSIGNARDDHVLAFRRNCRPRGRHIRRYEGVAISVDEEKRDLECGPALAQQELLAHPAWPDRTPDETQRAVAVSAGVRNVDIEELVGQVLWMRDEHLPPELAVPLA